MPYSEDEKFDISYVIQSMYPDGDRGEADRKYQAVISNLLTVLELKSLIHEVKEFTDNLELLLQGTTESAAIAVYGSSIQVGRRVVNALERQYLSLI